MTIVRMTMLHPAPAVAANAGTARWTSTEIVIRMTKGRVTTLHPAPGCP